MEMIMIAPLGFAPELFLTIVQQCTTPVQGSQNGEDKDFH